MEENLSQWRLSGKILICFGECFCCIVITGIVTRGFPHATTTKIPGKHKVESVEPIAEHVLVGGALYK